MSGVITPIGLAALSLEEWPRLLSLGVDVPGATQFDEGMLEQITADTTRHTCVFLPGSAGIRVFHELEAWLRALPRFAVVIDRAGFPAAAIAEVAGQHEVLVMDRRLARFVRIYSASATTVDWFLSLDWIDDDALLVHGARAED